MKSIFIKLSLMLITLKVFGADGAGIIEDHRCVNLKGENEQCGEFQYCSKSSLTKGCRDCEDIAERWCKLSKERISDFKRRFPKCGILCDLKELNETKEKLTKTENDLKASKREKAALVMELNITKEKLTTKEHDLKMNTKEKDGLDQVLVKKEEHLERLQTERDSLSEENGSLWLAVVALPSVIVVGLAVSVVCIVILRRKQKRLRARLQRTTPGTAREREESSGFRKLCSCIFPSVTGRAVSVQDDEESIQLTQPLNLGTQATPSAPPASELDSGHNTNSSQTVSSDSLTSAGPPQEELFSTTPAGTSAGN